MIQRIQTIFLLFVALLPLFFLSGNIVTFWDSKGSLGVITFSASPASATVTSVVSGIITGLFAAGLILSALLAAAAIFLFKYRKIQMAITLLSAFISLIITAIEAFILYKAASMPGNTIMLGIRLLIPPSMLLFALLAARGIRNDERLVKSYERLR